MCSYTGTRYWRSITYRGIFSSGNANWWHSPGYRIRAPRASLNRSVVMPIKLVIAVTDRSWFEHLRSRPDITEVNFWSPGATSFRALEAGELFFFKLHAPQ